MSDDYQSDAVFQKLKTIIADILKIDAEKIGFQSRFKEDLGVDSLDAVTLLCTYEDEFNKKIPDEDALKFSTVGDVYAYIKNQGA